MIIYRIKYGKYLQDPFFKIFHTYITEKIMAFENGFFIISSAISNQILKNIFVKIYKK